jgi:hypothetical protein
MDFFWLSVVCVNKRFRHVRGELGRSHTHTDDIRKVAGCDRRPVTCAYIMLHHPQPRPSSPTLMKALRGIVGSRPSTSPGSLPSTSTVFPSLHRLDLPTDQSHESPLLTLTLSAPSFLDVVVKDEFSDSPLYIIETHRDRTGIYRCETENITNVAKVQWPSRSKMISANAAALSGVSIQMHDGRWRATEEFLKFGSLFTYVSPPSLGLHLFPSHAADRHEEPFIALQVSQISHPTSSP